MTIIAKIEDELELLEKIHNWTNYRSFIITFTYYQLTVTDMQYIFILLWYMYY